MSDGNAQEGFVDITTISGIREHLFRLRNSLAQRRAESERLQLQLEDAVAQADRLVVALSSIENSISAGPSEKK